MPVGRGEPGSSLRRKAYQLRPAIEAQGGGPQRTRTVPALSIRREHPISVVLTSHTTDIGPLRLSPLSPSSLTEAGMRRCWRMPVIHGTRKPIMITGTVKFFNTAKGYGFIAPESGGGDAFVHISAVERAGMHSRDKDQRVSYERETDNRGKTSAGNLQAACACAGRGRQRSRPTG